MNMRGILASFEEGTGDVRRGTGDVRRGTGDVRRGTGDGIPN